MASFTPDFTAMLQTLMDQRVEFILVDGVAAALHGALLPHAGVSVSVSCTRKGGTSLKPTASCVSPG